MSFRRLPLDYREFGGVSKAGSASATNAVGEEPECLPV